MWKIFNPGRYPVQKMCPLKKTGSMSVIKDISVRRIITNPKFIIKVWNFNSMNVPKTYVWNYRGSYNFGLKFDAHDNDAVFFRISKLLYTIAPTVFRLIQGYESNAFSHCLFLCRCPTNFFPFALAVALVLNFTVAFAVSLLLVAVSQQLWKTYFFIL